MIGWDTRPLRVGDYRSCARFLNDELFCVYQVHLLLLPKKQDTKVRHERNELVGDILEDLRILFECSD